MESIRQESKEKLSPVEITYSLIFNKISHFHELNIKLSDHAQGNGQLIELLIGNDAEPSNSGMDLAKLINHLTDSLSEDLQASFKSDLKEFINERSHTAYDLLVHIFNALKEKGHLSDAFKSPRIEMEQSQSIEGGVFSVLKQG